MAMNNLTTAPRGRLMGVWVDSDVCIEGNSRKMKERFIGLSPYIEEWHFFTTEEQFYAYLDENPKINILLITSGSMAQMIVPARHDSWNIHSIFIFCTFVAKHRNLKDRYNKVKDVMNLEDDVYQRIADELSLFLLDVGESCVNSNDHGLAQNYINEALRLMIQILHLESNHGRIQKANELLDLDHTWNIT